jgi:hypothetical protein
MAYLDPTVTGKLRTGKNTKHDKEIGDLIVSLTRNIETADVDGNRLPFPMVELRLKIEVFRDDALIAIGQVPASSIADGVEEFLAESWEKPGAG